MAWGIAVAGIGKEAVKITEKSYRRCLPEAVMRGRGAEPAGNLMFRGL